MNDYIVAFGHHFHTHLNRRNVSKAEKKIWNCTRVFVFLCVNVGVKARATAHLRSFMNKEKKNNSKIYQCSTTKSQIKIILNENVDKLLLYIWIARVVPLYECGRCTIFCCCCFFLLLLSIHMLLFACDDKLPCCVGIACVHKCTFTLYARAHRENDWNFHRNSLLQMSMELSYR